MLKKRVKRTIIIVLSVFLSIVLICGAMLLIYSIQCSSITDRERAAMTVCEDSDEALSRIKYANYLKKAHNGYRDYYYYDVCTYEGNSYIVELRDIGFKLEYSSKNRYSGPINRLVILNDMISYRSSEMGQFSDRIDVSVG